MRTTLSGRLSQSQRECQDILTAPGPHPLETHPHHPPLDPWAGQDQHTGFFYDPPESDEDDAPMQDPAGNMNPMQFDPTSPPTRMDRARRASQDVDFLQRVGSARATPRGVHAPRTGFEDSPEHQHDAQCEEQEQEMRGLERAPEERTLVREVVSVPQSP